MLGMWVENAIFGHQDHILRNFGKNLRITWILKYLNTEGLQGGYGGGRNFLFYAFLAKLVHLKRNEPSLTVSYTSYFYQPVGRPQSYQLKEGNRYSCTSKLSLLKVDFFLKCNFPILFKLAANWSEG